MRRLARSLVVMGLLVAMLATMTGSALANSATISPHSQTHAHGVKSTWGLSWTGLAPFDAIFSHGDSTGIEIFTNGLSYNHSYTFFPCSTTTFTQILTVFDGHNPSLVAQDSSTSRESGGNPC
jgi:hypothetical protein